MGRNLPAIPARVEVEPVRRAARPTRGVGRWWRSPLGAAASDLAPELLRVAGQALQSRGASRPPLANLPPSGANGLTVSEVEIDLATPLVRRVVVRTASAWSVAPEVILAGQRPRSRARLGFGAAGVAGLAMLGVAAARRGPSLLSGRFSQGR